MAACLPRTAQAGGTEFPADGTRGLGRGGARAARADDPTIMTRNPAGLALLWDDQALLGAHLLLVDACMLPTGAYGVGIKGNAAFDLGEGPIYLRAGAGRHRPRRQADRRLRRRALSRGLLRGPGAVPAAPSR